MPAPKIAAPKTTAKTKAEGAPDAPEADAPADTLDADARIRVTGYYTYKSRRLGWYVAHVVGVELSGDTALDFIENAPESCWAPVE